MGRARTLAGIGFAVLVVAGAAAYATGAFTSSTADRTATISVTDDRSGLLGVQDCQRNDLVKQRDGQLTIALSRPGVGPNRDARFEVGDPAAPASDRACAPPGASSQSAAFRIVNQGTQPVDIRLAYEGDDANSRVNLRFELQHGMRSAPQPGESWKVTEEGQDGLVRDIGVGEAVYVAIFLDTDDPADLSGGLNATATVH